jgi:hypothetical protein
LLMLMLIWWLISGLLSVCKSGGTRVSIACSGSEQETQKSDLHRL